MCNYLDPHIYLTSCIQSVVCAMPLTWVAQTTLWLQGAIYRSQSNPAITTRGKHQDSVICPALVQHCASVVWQQRYVYMVYFAWTRGADVTDRQSCHGHSYPPPPPGRAFNVYNTLSGRGVVTNTARVGVYCVLTERGGVFLSIWQRDRVSQAYLLIPKAPLEVSGTHLKWLLLTTHSWADWALLSVQVDYSTVCVYCTARVYAKYCTPFLGFTPDAQAANDVFWNTGRNLTRHLLDTSISTRLIQLFVYQWRLSTIFQEIDYL